MTDMLRLLCLAAVAQIQGLPHASPPGYSLLNSRLTGSSSIDKQWQEWLDSPPSKAVTLATELQVISSSCSCLTLSADHVTADPR